MRKPPLGGFFYYQRLLLMLGHQQRSITIAMPWPTPMDAALIDALKVAVKNVIDTDREA